MPSWSLKTSRGIWKKAWRRCEAALEGSKEIGFTVLSMSVSLVAVFIPILMMGGILGRIFREFAITLSVAVGLSLVVSLTATPMMCAKLLKPHQQNKREKGLFRILQRGFDLMAEEYASTLRWALRRSSVHAVHSAGYGLPGGLSLRDHSQGLLSAAGYRTAQRPGPELGGYFLSRPCGRSSPSTSTSSRAIPRLAW